MLRGSLILFLLLGTAFAARAKAETPPEPEAQVAPVATEAGTESAAPDSDPAEALPVGASAMRVVRDPETGQWRAPNAEERRTLSPTLQGMLSRSSVGLTPVHHRNGMVTLDLQGRFRNASVARRQADGTMKVDCVGHTHGAETALDAEAEVTSEREEQ